MLDCESLGCQIGLRVPARIAAKFGRMSLFYVVVVQLFGKKKKATQTQESGSDAVSPSEAH